MNNLVKLVSRHLIKNKTLENFKISKDLITELKKNNFSQYKFTPGCYNRNSLHTEDNFEILLLLWDVNSMTPLHTHPENGCVLLLLEGTLKEKIVNENMILYNKINRGEQSYIDDELGKHMIVATKKSMSIHIYSPPNFSNNK